MKTLPLWKLVVERRLEMAEITRVDRPAEPAAEMRGVELQRVDTTPDRTTIFVAGSREGAGALADALGGKLAEASADELRARAPAAP
jgi:hypothetical protein